MKLKKDDIWYKIGYGYQSDEEDNWPGLIAISENLFNQPSWASELWVNVILEAGKNKDVDYVESEHFERLCKYIGLNPYILRGVINEVWKNQY